MAAKFRLKPGAMGKYRLKLYKPPRPPFSFTHELSTRDLETLARYGREMDQWERELFSAFNVNLKDRHPWKWVAFCLSLHFAPNRPRRPGAKPKLDKSDPTAARLHLFELVGRSKLSANAAFKHFATSGKSKLHPFYRNQGEVTVPLLKSHYYRAKKEVKATVMQL